MSRVKGWIGNAAHHVDKTRPNLLCVLQIVPDLLFWCMTQIDTQNLICANGPHYEPDISHTTAVSLILEETGHRFT